MLPNQSSHAADSTTQMDIACESERAAACRRSIADLKAELAAFIAERKADAKHRFETLKQLTAYTEAAAEISTKRHGIETEIRRRLLAFQLQSKRA